ncbi:MAG: STAS domain-containing protein [Polyangiaceae bacterium]|nr:STAS domain-containing protein [Polyangiaceae bacterium]
MHARYLRTLKFDELELASRRTFFRVTDEDLARLASLRSFAEKHTEAIVEAFYELLLGHPETAKFFSDELAVKHVKKLQRDYFLQLFDGRCDLAYVENRLRVGAAHERIGLAPKWYLGAYRRYLEVVREQLFKTFPSDEARASMESITRIVFFDMSIAIDTYIAANLETIGRHQLAIRELSTPVIRVHERILLMPLIGTIDSLRANQIMDALLLRVVEEQARFVIVDIAGVPVVDTKVADSLLKTTAAVRMLGAQVILTGISAPIARTLVQLGVDVSSMHTCARLQEGIELALQLAGKVIVDREKGGAP